MTVNVATTKKSHVGIYGKKKKVKLGLNDRWNVIKKFHDLILNLTC
jgi:hypothetical protein